MDWNNLTEQQKKCIEAQYMLLFGLYGTLAESMSQLVLPKDVKDKLVEIFQTRKQLGIASPEEIQLFSGITTQ